jgi:uncharacterized membrane protein YkvA (DUF1232 family)
MRMKKKIELEKEQHAYEIKAKEYLKDPKKVERLVNQAVQKSKRQKGTLGIAWDRLKLFIELIKAYSNGEYRKVSKGTIITVIGAIIYFVSPVDVVPDFIAGLGIVDDAAVIGFALKKIGSEIEDFKNWKNQHKPESPLD